VCFVRGSRLSEGGIQVGAMRSCLLIAAVCVASTFAQSFRFPSSPNHRQGSRFTHLPPIAADSRQGFARPPAPIASIPTSSFSGSGDACSPNPCGPNTRCQLSRTGFAQCHCINDLYVPIGNTANGCKVQCDRDDDCGDEHRCQGNRCVEVCTAGACAAHANCDSRNHKAQCSCQDGYDGDGFHRCSKIPAVQRQEPDFREYNPCDSRYDACHTTADCRTTGFGDTVRAVCTCPPRHEGNPLSQTNIRDGSQAGCRRLECVEHSDCPSNRACHLTKCVDPCSLSGICGLNAECTARDHRPICSCPRNHRGSSLQRCTRLTKDYVCGESCGRNTNCEVNADFRATCSCIQNYIGNPLIKEGSGGCRPECTSDRDCPSHQTCKDNRCRNPCAYGACGDGAHCNVVNNRVDCKCPENFKGDPFDRCYAECTHHDDCSNNQACIKLSCADPCINACGTNAECRVDDHQPICSCPKGYTGRPFESCRPFTRADVCSNNPCGREAMCEPGEDVGGKLRAVCYCPTGYLGNAKVECIKGDCTDPSQCPRSQTCHLYKCEDPCNINGQSVCGSNAQCKVNENRQPVCFCPRGYEGNALQSCFRRR